MGSLGISFSGKCIRFVGLDAAGKVERYKEAESDIDFSSDLTVYNRNASAISSTAHIIKDTIHDENFDVTNVSFSVDSNNAFLNILPVDFSEEEQNIRSRILWDLSNYFPDSYKNFRINYIKLGEETYSGNIYNILLVAMHKNLNLFFGKVFEEAGLGVKIFDLDQFAVDKCVASLPGASPSNYMIAGFRKHRVDLSYFSNGKLSSYYYFLYKDVNLEKALNSELKILNGKGMFSGLEHVYVYGEDTSEFASNIIKNYLTEIPVSLIDVPPGDTIANKDRLKRYSYKFAAAYALALKGLQEA